MNTVLQSKRIDQIGISFLSVLLILSFVFRVFPVSIMNPGFPILTHLFARIERTTNLYDASKVSYSSIFSVSDNSQSETSFSIKHGVTRFSSSTEAMAALQAGYNTYRSENLPNPEYELSVKFITDIPDLSFASKADKYYLWCEQRSPNKDLSYVPAYAGEKVDTCYYWSVYGRFYSELRVSMWPISGSGRYFSVDIFNDALNRADRKLSVARWWFK